MPQGSITFTVKKSPSEAFAYIADMENAPNWVPDLVSVEKATPGDVRVGTVFNEVVRMGDKEMAGSMEVTEYDPPRVYAHAGEGGPSKFSARFTFEADGEGTRVVHDYEVEVGGVLKLMSPVIGGWVKCNSERAVEELKRILD